MSYFCNICNKSYSSNKSLWSHNKKYHKTIIEEYKNNIGVIQEYKCDFCD